MKNILIIISWLKIWWWAEKSATMVWNWLYKKWYTIKYLTFYDAKEKYNFKWEEFCLYEKISNNPLINLFKLFKRAYQIKKYWKKNNIDTFLSFMEEANFPNILSKFLWNKSKIIVSIRTNIDKKSWVYKKLIKYLYPKADFITTIVKEWSYNLIQNYWIKPEKVQNIYNMFDIKNIQEKSKEGLWEYKNLFSNWKFTFINIWRFFKPKNQELLLDSFYKFHKKNTNSQLIVLWDGELKQELQNKKESLSSSKDIHFLWLHKNPYKFLANSNAFVFSSSWEGMGRVLVEAMACWLPVVSTDCKVWPKEVLRKNSTNFDMVNLVSKEEYGILVPVDDENSLFQAMQDLYDDVDLQKHYSKQSKSRAKDFDVGNVINEWENIL